MRVPLLVCIWWRVFQLTPDATGTRIDAELIRRPKTLTRRLLAALLPLVAPAALKKWLAGPSQAK